jgi:hypothetical protein
MAFSKIAINKDTWTLIGNNVATITFQNVGQQQIYISTTTTNVAPTSMLGLVYDLWQGEFKVSTTSLTVTGGTYVWAKTVSGTSGGSVIVDV